MLTTHRMAYEMSEYLTPPVLCRAQTDPTSTYETRRPQPASPPPTYEEVMKEVPFRTGVAKFIGPWAVDYFDKSTPWARQKTPAGQIWTPVLSIEKLPLNYLFIF